MRRWFVRRFVTGLGCVAWLVVVLACRVFDR